MRHIVTTLSLFALAACGADTVSAPDPVSDSAQTRTTAPTSISTPAPTLIPTLAPLWVLDGFDAPESVIADPDGRTYYVSNVGGEGRARDANGSISRIDADGTLLDRAWVTGTDALPLHGPKGMTLVDGTLFVTDIDHIVLIDPVAARVVQRIAVPDAGFLNDAARGPDGDVLISDSANARIYRLAGGDVSVWLEDDRLDGVNGLQMDDGALLVTTMTAGDLLSVDPATKAITGLATGMENADGIGVRADGSYMVSSWPGQLWHVRAGEAPTLLQDTGGDAPVLMNDVLFLEDMVIAPNWRPGTVRAYAVQ